jgi:hypothetical protein
LLLLLLLHIYNLFSDLNCVCACAQKEVELRSSDAVEVGILTFRPKVQGGEEMN